MHTNYFAKPRLQAVLIAGTLSIAGTLLSGSGLAKKLRRVDDESRVRPIELREMAQKLISGDLATRSPGTLGDKQARYLIAAQMLAMHLQPGLPPTDDKELSGFLQPLPLFGVRTRIALGGIPLWKSTAATVPVQVGSALSDVLLLAGAPQPTLALREAEVVFVGYGLSAPTLRWDDYKDTNVSGKVVLILDGEPPGARPSPTSQEHPYQSRWPHKFAQAAKKGAAGALIIHFDKEQGASHSNLDELQAVYGNGNEYLLDRDVQPNDETLRIYGFMNADAARRVLQAAHLELDDLRRAAEERDFRPVRPRLKVDMAIANDIRPIESANIVGVLPGTEPQPQKEAIVYSAHLDGKNSINTATGVAAILAMARAATNRKVASRSLIFAVTSANTELLLGDRYLLSHLPAPVAKVVAHINVEGIDPLFAKPTVLQVGRGKSTLDQLLYNAARGQTRKVVAGLSLDLGLYYRSGSLAFASAGIPSLFLAWPELFHSTREDAIGQKGPINLEANWNFLGGALDAELMLAVGNQLAEAKSPPSFLANDEFAGLTP